MVLVPEDQYLRQRNLEDINPDLVSWVTWILPDGAVADDGRHHVEVTLGPGGGGMPTDEILIIADTSASDQTVTLPDPATLPSLTTIINVKNWNSAGYELHIDPGVGVTIDSFTDGIRTRTDNQGYRFRWGPSADEGPVDGWVCIETIFGGGEGGTASGPPPEGTPGLQACDDVLPDWILDYTLAADYQVLTDESGTYTKPAVSGAHFVACVGWGSGAGGSEGAANNSGDYTAGGAGSGGGARKAWIWDYDSFPASVAYAIHQGGLGALGRTCPPDTAGAGTRGSDGGPSTLTESTTGDVFFVGGGLAGDPGIMINLASTGGQGGSFEQDGTTLADNVNGYDGFGAGGMRANAGDETGNAECGGASGAGHDEPGTWPEGGSSLHGGCGSGHGGAALVAPLDLTQPTAGGSTGSTNGGGGAPGVSGLPGSQDAGSGAPGTGLDGGQGAGGGGAMFTPDTSGEGGDGGIPGGAGGPSGAVFGGGTKKTGAGGKGARGELRMYVI
jgi:hypothetical protein